MTFHQLLLAERRYLSILQLHITPNFCVNYSDFKFYYAVLEYCLRELISLGQCFALHPPSIGKEVMSMRPLLNKGFNNEPINWELVSQSESNGLITSVFEAPSKKYDKIYHLIDISGDDISVKQHLSFR